MAHYGKRPMHGTSEKACGNPKASETKGGIPPKMPGSKAWSGKGVQSSVDQGDKGIPPMGGKPSKKFMGY